MTDYRNNPGVKELRKLISESDDPLDKIVFTHILQQFTGQLRLHKKLDEIMTRIHILEKTNLERALRMK